uniref:dual specificity protein phosphatase 23-like n=1 Tax=Styela clava TaxID=7725 RepID=UPI00193AD18E|nr:dual specificity protein phosphatase 23-like [Styela clava]
MALHSHENAPPPNFSWVDEGFLAGCGCPGNLDHYKYFTEVGIRHVISLKEQYPPGAEENSKSLNLKLSKIQIKDFHPPTIDQIDEFLKLVDEGKKCNQPVVTHCALGNGRTGTMLACYLLKQKGISAKEALDEIRKLRPGSVETVEQEKAIEMYYKHLNETATD